MGKYDNNENLIELIKNTPVDKLQLVADSLRKELIEDVSISGGHLASNLGVVELTVALHKVFDSPKDKIIWDVGHQCYVHKMITGRKNLMKNIRHIDGISGFPKRYESVHDMYDSGHTSTSISAALGYACARDLKGENYSCIAVIGDGALTGGVAFEGLNNAGSSNTPLIVVLNDNQMSIGNSVGSTSKSLNRIRTSKSYIGFKEAIKTTKNTVPWFYKFLKNFRDLIKYAFVPDQMFEDLGFKYYGPIDGHNIEEMVKALEFAKDANRPIILHMLTKKGKGFEPAELDPSRFHGTGPFDVTNCSKSNSESKKSWSSIFGNQLLKLADSDPNIVAISAAMVEATGLLPMQKKYPERVFDVGIAEQHAVSFAAGLALNGFKPVVAIYSTFLQRAYDEIITEVCLQNLPVVFAIDRAGITGADGETHQGMFDIAYLSSMPNMTILSACDENSFRGCIEYALTLNTPCAIRYGKTPVAENKLPEYENYHPSEKYLIDGNEYMIITDGAFAETARMAASKLDKSIAVCNFEVLKPLNIDLVKKVLRDYKAVITIEDGTVIGGFGSQIAQIASQSKEFCKVLNLGWPDKFIEHGSVKELRNRYKLDEEGLIQTAEAFFED